MTRRQLAADSGLSERFLADVEGGKGNVSINSLAAAARALNITVIDLLHDAPRPPLARAQGLLARQLEGFGGQGATTNRADRETRNSLAGTIEEVAFLGSVVRIKVKVGDNLLSLDTFNNPGVTPPERGSAATVTFAPADVLALQGA